MPRIPWGAIVTHGPAIVAAAKRLIAPADDAQAKSIETRLNQLEAGSMESARLLHDMAQQVQALAVAQAQTAQRARIAVGLGVTALVVAIGATILAMIW